MSLTFLNIALRHPVRVCALSSTGQQEGVVLIDDGVEIDLIEHVRKIYRSALPYQISFDQGKKRRRMMLRSRYRVTRVEAIRVGI